MSLHPHFMLVGIEPGIVITFQFGALDFRENVPLPVLEKLYNDGFPYLKLTKLGQKAMFPKPTTVGKPAEPPTTQPLNPSTTQPSVGEPVEPSIPSIPSIPSTPKKKSRARKSK